MLPFGGFPLHEGAHDSEEPCRKSHSGILGSMAACAYPRRYRSLSRPSSALKPSHSPDGVTCRALAVSIWRLVNTFFYVTARRSWPMHGVIVSFLSELLSPFTLHWLGAELHLFLMAFCRLLSWFRSCYGKYKGCVDCIKGFEVGFCCDWVLFGL